MKKTKLTLSYLRVSSFIPDTSKLRGGAKAYEPIMTPPDRATGDTCLCAPTYWEGCEEG
ncbi:hypothetical protein AB9P05_11990 [Roseivirga sp. BDSF3-8]|uniref:hypothetical protein n=1 Tax=Roseivirga sp. BDSF3-8 TaxID=3241598 RepID=UPI0035328066